MEIDLFPVTTLYGGELCFGPEAGEDALHAYAAWARAVPETMASSVLLLSYPDDPAVAPELRGRHVTHVRLADSGADPAAGHDLVDRLRAAGPRLVDTVRSMPYSDVGTIHHEPTDTPVAAFDRNVLLRDFDDDAAHVLAKLAGPDAAAPFLTELRAWSGALSRPPAVPNAVTGRDAAFSLMAIAGPEPAHRAARDQLLAAMAPWSTGGSYPNFSGVEDATADGARRRHRPRRPCAAAAGEAAPRPGRHVPGRLPTLSGVPGRGRGARLDAAVATMRAVWSGELTGQGGPMRRLPAGRPALLFGGLVQAAFTRAATHGDGWVAPLFGHDTLLRGAEAVRTAWTRPGEPRIVTGRYVSLGAARTADRYLRHYYGAYWTAARADTVTTAGELRDELARLDDIGVTDVVLYPCDAGLDQVARLADAVAAVRPSAAVA